MITKDDAQTLRNLIAGLELDVWDCATTGREGLPLAQAQATLTRGRLEKFINSLTEISRGPEGLHKESR